MQSFQEWKSVNYIMEYSDVCSPFFEVAEEFLIEFNSRSDDLSWYMTE